MEGGCKIVDIDTYKEALAIKEQADNLQKEVRRLIKEVEELTHSLEWAREKLKEAQERNRKLEWLLTRAMEEL